MRIPQAWFVVVTACCLTATSLSAQTQSTTTGTSLRSATLTLGVGNTAGWFGLRGEKYLNGDRSSLSGGLGYTPASDGYEAAGLTVAIAARRYTAGRRHRGFVELSFSQVQVETEYSISGQGHWQGRYGPGIQLGYQLVTASGFTLDLSAGAGYALGGGASGSRVQPLIGLGIGYTFR